VLVTVTSPSQSGTATTDAARRFERARETLDFARSRHEEIFAFALRHLEVISALRPRSLKNARSTYIPLAAMGSRLLLWRPTLYERAIVALREAMSAEDLVNAMATGAAMKGGARTGGGTADVVRHGQQEAPHYLE
jgi:hypothetical protein